MIKKILLFSLVVSQLTISCSNNDSSGDDLSEQIDNIMKMPYSQLTPAEQKVKLEAEANEALTELEKVQNSVALGAVDNLTRLLEISPIDTFNGTDSNGVEDILGSSSKGIYTWNNTNQSWTKTNSSSELKFVFPSSESQTKNNTSFSTKSTSTEVKNSNGESISVPASSSAVLTIDKVEAATFTQSAKYSNGNEIPSEVSYKMTLKDGYAWEIKSANGSENNTAKASFTFKGKNLLEFNSGSTADIDAVMGNSELTQYKGKATGLVKIMDNFAIVYQTDLENSAIDDDNLEKSLPIVDYNYESKDYYTSQNAYNLQRSQGIVANFNKNTKGVLVSLKDGTKIADVVKRSEIDYSYTDNVKWIVDNDYPNGGYWDYDQNYQQTVNYYHEVDYLKFNDNTEVEMSAYFSEGFDDFENNFNNFISGF